MYHADEGVQSYQTWRLIQSGEYRYDPTEHHGPLLYYATKWLYPIIGDASGELTDAGRRRIPTLFSLGIVVFFVLGLRRFGEVETLCGALLVAVAPLPVIYGSYYIQESLLAFFSLGFAYFIFRYWKAASVSKAILAGLSLGLMHVTKETAVLHVFAVAVAVLALMAVPDFRTLRQGTFRWIHLAWFSLPVLALHVVFFSSLFTHWQGVWDGVLAYFNYADRSRGQGHEKEIAYYLSLFLPQTKEGVAWSSIGLFVLLALGFWRVFSEVRKGKTESSAWACFVAICGIALLVVYSLIPYKNPWLFLFPFVALSLVMGKGAEKVVNLFRASSGRRRLLVGFGATVFFLAVGKELWRETRNAVFIYPSAARNPYLYSHTTPRYAGLLDRLRSVDRESVTVGVYSPDFAWPLPWHLRDWKHVGFWTDVKGQRPHSIDIYDTRVLSDGVPEGTENDFWELHGLRVNTLLTMRVSDEIASKWIKSD